MNEKTVYLMRGLPSCGKSYTARRLAGDQGVVCETDEYFYTEIGAPNRYDYDEKLLDAARRWNFERFMRVVLADHPLIVVDRGNSVNLESHVYARVAADHGYQVELKEPESECWQEIRVLLKYKPITLPILRGWARQLAKMSRANHRVPLSTIQHWMDRWKWDVTIEDILNYTPSADEDKLFDAYLAKAPLYKTRSNPSASRT